MQHTLSLFQNKNFRSIMNARRDNVIAGASDGRNRHELRGLARRRSNGGYALL